MGPTAILTHRERSTHSHQPPLDAAMPLGDAAVGHWRLDPTKSSAGFAHKSLWGLVTVRGTFAHLSGEGEILADGSFRGKIVVPAASLDTKHAKRDKHLRSADFFDARRHPSIVFTTMGVDLDDHGILRIDGLLEAGGISRRISVPSTSVEASLDHVKLEAEFQVDRSDFNMAWNKFGMLRGSATVSIVATFTHIAP